MWRQETDMNHRGGDSIHEQPPPQVIYLVGSDKFSMWAVLCAKRPAKIVPFGR